MADREVAAFLAGHRVLTCATNGPRGWPHLMPLWYVIRDDGLWAWTYAKSQKVRNAGYRWSAAESGFMDAVRAQAAKRVALQLTAKRTASWEHRKLGGAC